MEAASPEQGTTRISAGKDQRAVAVYNILGRIPRSAEHRDTRRCCFHDLERIAPYR